MEPNRPIVVLFVPVLFQAERWNGIMEHLRTLIDRLDAQVFQPKVVHLPTDGEQIRLLSERTKTPVVDGSTALSILSFRRLVIEARASLVHIHTPVAQGLARRAVGARLAGIPVLVTYHQVQLHAASGRARVMGRLTQRLVRENVAVASAVRESLVHNAGFSPQEIRVIRNGVDARHDAGPLRKGPPTRRIGYVGRLAAEKRVDLVIRAFARLREQGRADSLLIIGEGYERRSLETEAARLGVASQVQFTGHVDDPRTVMDQIDLLVHPASFEGLPYALIEALEAGIPIVARKSAGGVGEVVEDGVTGVLVASDDMSDLANAVGQLLDDPTRMAHMSASARERYAREFSAEMMVNRTVQLYEQAIK